MENITERSPVTCLEGVGKSRALGLSRLGVQTVGDLIRLYPRAYENRGDIKLLANCEDGEKQAVVLTVATLPKKSLIRRGMSLLKFRAYDDSGVAEITYFNQDYLADKFELGASFRFYGRVEKKQSRSGKYIFSMSSPIPELFKEFPHELPPLVPVYPLTASLSQNLMRGLVKQGLRAVKGSVLDPLPEEIKARNGLPSRSFAQKNIHEPSQMKELAAAKKRLIFDEFFLFSLGISIVGREKRSSFGAPECKNNDISPLLSLLPYSLTGAQERVIDEIKEDMAKDVPMSRLLVGDVGCGKTICAAAAIYIACKNGIQAALMAPTEILATQHYGDLKPIFEALGIKAELLTGSTSPSEKRRIYRSIAESDVNERTEVLIGTHALISEGVEFSQLGLVITDEQHRFGVRQRSALGEKGKPAHMLVMSATPIPRSLALTRYGGLELSTIDEMPPGRQRVDTFYVDESYRERLYAFIKKLTAEGGQVYVVCPAVEEKNQEDDVAEGEGDIFFEEIGTGGLSSLFYEEKEKTPPLKSAVKYAEELKARLPELNISFVHGRMKAKEKDAVMGDFAAGRIDVLVSTTVIEVGVNVPNACLMIVENAERFGLSQLHQLRGRVGRGTRKSYCVLVSDSRGESAKMRLDTMKNIYDGFAIAEKDLSMRGPGDFIASSLGRGIRQSGDMRFRLADMSCDGELFTAAIREARAVLKEDPTLKNHPELLFEVGELFDMGSDY